MLLWEKNSFKLSFPTYQIFVEEKEFVKRFRQTIHPKGLTLVTFRPHFQLIPEDETQYRFKLIKSAEMKESL